MSKKKVGNQMIKYPFFIRNSTCFFVIFNSFIRFRKCANDKRKKRFIFKENQFISMKKKSRIQKKKEKVSYANLRVDFWTNQKEKKQTNLSNGV